MRVLISSVGTRGDVQPALALALEVRDLGHEVSLCIPPNFTEWASRLSLEARPLGIEMRTPRSGEMPKAQPKVGDLIADQFRTVAAAANGCDVIVGAGIHQYAARSIAELHDIPFVIAAYAPVSLPSIDLPPPGNDIGASNAETIARMWDDSKQAWNSRVLEPINDNRKHLGLSAVEDVLMHILGDQPWLAADPSLAPPPSMSNSGVVQLGAWILPDATPLPPALEAFLDDGEPPVYFGLGSMPAPSDTSRPLIEAARAAGRRVIISRGWANLEFADEARDCLSIDEVNHHALFPRVSVVVHHGGAGTTTAAALAGVPQIATPVFNDQFYFGRRISALGIGASVPFRDLNVGAVASALELALTPSVADRAQDFSKAVIFDGATMAAKRLATMLRL